MIERGIESDNESFEFDLDVNDIQCQWGHSVSYIASYYFNSHITR